MDGLKTAFYFAVGFALSYFAPIAWSWIKARWKSRKNQSSGETVTVVVFERNGSNYSNQFISSEEYFAEYRIDPKQVDAVRIKVGKHTSTFVIENLNKPGLSDPYDGCKVE